MAGRVRHPIESFDIAEIHFDTLADFPRENLIDQLTTASPAGAGSRPGFESHQRHRPTA